MAISLYFDEDTAHGRVVTALRGRGIDVETADELGTLGWADAGHLALATERNRVLVTGNVGDFMVLNAGWLAAGRTHAGLILIHQQRLSIGETIRRLTTIAVVASPEDMRDRYEFLSKWA